MANKEATARIKINKLLEAAGWRFFAEGKLPANIQLEPSITPVSGGKKYCQEKRLRAGSDGYDTSSNTDNANG